MFGEVGDDFVDYEWVVETLKAQKCECRVCRTALQLVQSEFNNEDWSIDRKKNSVGHVKSNCRITCVRCNKSLQ